MKDNYTRKQPLVRTLALGVAIGASAFMSGRAVAQPPAGGGQGQNPPNLNPGGGGNRPDFRTMTPEQRQQFFDQQRAGMQERMLRGILDRSGFNNTTQQDDIVAFSKEQDKATESLQTMAEKLVTAVSTMGVPDTEVARLLKEFQDAVAKEKERRKTARAELDKKVTYTKQPRLEMTLTMFGLLSDDSLSIGGMMGRMLGGGGQGGAGGGRGGQGGAGGAGGAGAQGNAGRQN